MSKAVKKKNPQDTTLRNVRAAVKRLKALELRVEILEHIVSGQARTNMPAEVASSVTGDPAPVEA